MITEEQIKEAFPSAKDDIAAAIVDSIDILSTKYEINSPLRLAHFLAQCAHESGGFRVTEENLNYKAEGLVATFHKYFPDEDTAQEYAHNPEKIANRVYANRMGNGDENSGDGYHFRGHGLIQLTGRHNYTYMSQDFGVSLDEVVEFLATPKGAVESAGWFWNNSKVNSAADEDNCEAVTRKVNGGTIGLDEREANTAKFKEILGV